MISTGILRKDDHVLMVRQYTKRGDIIWNFPGGGVEEGESFEEACVREMKEETGYDVVLGECINYTEKRIVFLCGIIGGVEGFDKALSCNDDLIELKWVPLSDGSYFDEILQPIYELLQD